MSKIKTEQAEALSLTTPQEALTMLASETGNNPAPVKTAARTEKKAGGIYTPKKREIKPAKLTVDQFLKQAGGVKEGIGGLARSMYGEKIMTFAEWENTLKTLLKRQVS
jgi:hypothetical protein